MIETLISLEPLRDRLVEAGQPPHCSRPGTRGRSGTAWRCPRPGTISPFADVAEAALRGLTSYTISDEQVAQLMAGFGELPAYPDALPAVRPERGRRARWPA